MEITYKEDELPTIEEVVSLYESVGWGHSKCPEAAYNAIKNSSYVVTAWQNNNLVGLGKAISDETITVYFPDLLVKPNFQGKKIGTQIMQLLLLKYGQLHNQVLIAEDDKAKKFYKKMGFEDEKFALSISKPFPTA